MNKRFLSVEVAQQNTLKRLQTLEDLTRTGVEVGVSDVEVVVSGVDVAGIGGPTAIIMVLELH
jgi:hypothetical protein